MSHHYESVNNSPGISTPPSKYHNDPHRYSIGVHGHGHKNVSVSPDDTIPAIMIVDSSRRNRDKWIDPSHYQIVFNNPFKDVTSIELISGSMPNSGYIVNPNSNTVTFRYNKDQTNIGEYETFKAVLGTGNYDIDEFLEELIDSINIAVDRDDDTAQYQFTGVVDEVTFRITIINPNSDTLDEYLEFIPNKENNIDAMIGLGNNIISSDSGEITMPNNYSLIKNRYIVLKIHDIERCEGNSPTLRGAFAVIPLDVSTNNFLLSKDGDIVDNDTYIHHFPQPVRTLNKLVIDFYDPDGNLYNFNGRDHYLVFRIYSLARPLKYKTSIV